MSHHLSGRPVLRPEHLLTIDPVPPLMQRAYVRVSSAENEH